MSEIIKLKHPFSWKNQHIDSLEVRKIKPKHLEAMDEMKGESSRANALYASLCNVPVDVIREMDMEDYASLSDVVLAMLGKSRVTGEESS